MTDSLPPLILRMLQPSFYPHSVSKPIEIVQTHISYVVLTGEYAYKIKKPIKLSFLDFSTLEKRHHFCQEELRLNRILAPNLYIAVLPIIEISHRQFKIAKSQTNIEQVIEYVIQMHQFEKDGLELLQENLLTFTHMQSLGKQIALYHSEAETNSKIQSYGSVEVICHINRENFTLSRSYINKTLSPSRYQNIFEYINHFLSDHSEWLEKRQFQHKIRECHGDLHLKNLCLFQDKLQAFDCIEFNQEFRYIDILYDVAFLVMDLTYYGHLDYANEFLNEYLEKTDDYSGVNILPLYLIMRAFIRGNVTSLTCEDSLIPPSEKAILKIQAQAYYKLASDYTYRPQGRVILMSGISGSGKTTVARNLSRKINAIRIRSDAVRKHIAGISLLGSWSNENSNQNIYTPEMTYKTYKRLVDSGLQLAKQGVTVILDAKYDKRNFRHEVITRTKAAKIPLNIIVCKAPLEVIRNRLMYRTNDISDANISILETQLNEAEDFNDTEKPFIHIVNTDQDLDSQLLSFIE